MGSSTTSQRAVGEAVGRQGEGPRLARRAYRHPADLEGETGLGEDGRAVLGEAADERAAHRAGSEDSDADCHLHLPGGHDGINAPRRRCRPARYAAPMPASSPAVGRASAPASSANLGPGFDVLALALGLRCSVRVAPAGEWALSSAGADAGSLALVRRAAEAAVGGCGPYEVEVASAIPVGRGLGSSAALVVGVVAAVRAAAGWPESREEVVRVAAAVEGHADNVAAAVHGGAVAVSPGGRVYGLEVHPSLRVLVAVPKAVLPTAVAREALRGPIDTATAARAPRRGLAFLVEGCAGGMPPFWPRPPVTSCTRRARAHLSPLTGALVAAAREAGAAHAAWSGAGPSALALVGDDAAAAVRAAWESLLAGEGARAGAGVGSAGPAPRSTRLRGALSLPLVFAFIETVRRWAASVPAVRAVALVGSHASGRARPDSDVDLVVLCDDPGPCSPIGPGWRCSGKRPR